MSNIKDQTNQAWHDFLLSLTGMTKEQLSSPKTIGLWSVKDIMAHITAWEDIFLEACEEYLEGTVPQIFELNWREEGDAINADLWEEFKDITIPEAWSNLNETHLRYMQALNSDILMGEPDMKNLAEEIGHKHYMHHAKKVREYSATIPSLAEGIAYYLLKSEHKPNLENPEDWKELEASQEYIQCALTPEAVTQFANRIYRQYEGELSLVLFDLSKFQPEAVQAKERTVFQDHIHGWFKLDAAIGIRSMHKAESCWIFPWS